MPLIRRTQPTSDQLPPWTGLAFTDKIGTDEFYEHLKKTYPRCDNQWERKHMAAIDFLIWELQQARSPYMPKDKGQRSLASPDASIPLNDGASSHEDSSRSSPTSLEFLDSSVNKNNVKPSIELKEVPVPAVASKNIAPTSNGMTQYVFNAINGQEHEPRKRRKMSPDEKRAYKRMRRRGGACDSCRRNKEKCIHNLDRSADFLRTNSVSRELGSILTQGHMTTLQRSLSSSRQNGDTQSEDHPGLQVANDAPTSRTLDNETAIHPTHVPQNDRHTGWNGVEAQGALPEQPGYVHNHASSGSAYDDITWSSLEFDGQYPQHLMSGVYQSASSFQDRNTTRYKYHSGHNQYSQEPFMSLPADPD